MKPSETIINKLLELSGKQCISIAFCPYKMAMWDCMEPVYRLALETSGIRADIIPLDFITYPDGQRHNERDAFIFAGFNALPLTALRENSYDFIIIHYPYDQQNNVTSMTPECCSDSLQNFGKVVYIPYHGNIAGPEWSRFYATAGANNCNYICLGSDQDVAAFLERNPGREYKVIQTDGSTKAECAELHKSDPIPEQYKELRHPVTLICGTLHTFTRDPFERMHKHRSAIEAELKQGHAVIYRPHPLVYEAIAVMRPEALPEYKAFLEEVADNVAVLDSTPFLHQAMRVADKLICDPSSVQRTWTGTGKPIEVME